MDHPPDQERRPIFDDVCRLLANVAGSPGTLLLDGLQRVGADALDLVSSLPHQAPGALLRVVSVYRETEVAPDRWPVRYPDPWEPTC